MLPETGLHEPDLPIWHVGLILNFQLVQIVPDGGK